MRRLQGLDIRSGIEVYVFDPNGRVAGHIVGQSQRGDEPETRPTVITDALSKLWNLVSAPFSSFATKQVAALDRRTGPCAW